ncbi:hypothetical protein ARAF_1610 [Arsenophonus endosymbiont of Aleurodicus floccissimus]|nr:hypothetical protein ARAF_1610 [Arsenophonus endosymbiont of Aleurodicus floccissimus]
MAGYYAKLICPLFFIRFVVSTVSKIDTEMEKKNIYLLFNIVLLITSLAIIYILYGFLLRYMAKGKVESFTLIIFLAYPLYFLYSVLFYSSKS